MHFALDKIGGRLELGHTDGNVEIGDSFRKNGLLIASLDLDGKAARDEPAVGIRPTLRL